MTTEELKSRMDVLALEVNGRVAYAFEHPASGACVKRDPSDRFISASVIKVPILMEAFRQAVTGELCWDEEMTVREAEKVGGSGVLKVLHDGLRITVLDAAVLMTVVSDNTATNMVLERIGAANVNRFIRDHDCSVTECVRKLYDWPLIEKGIHNYIAAGEINALLTLTAQGVLNGPTADTALLDIMKKQQYRDRIPHLLPEDTITATKSGSLDEVSHDCGIVYLPSGDWFALTICFGDLKGREDGASRDAENNVMSRMAVSCYQYALANAPA